jgi:hypothetical protein
MLLASEFLKYKANLRVPHHIRNLFMFLLVLTGVAVTSGCTLNKPYAKNPYNLYVKLPDDSVTASSGARTSKAIDLALSASSRPIPGAIPHGAGVGIAAAAFLLGSEGTNKPINGNFLLGSMPITMANSEQEAKIKLGSIIEKLLPWHFSLNIKSKSRNMMTPTLLGRHCAPDGYVSTDRFVKTGHAKSLLRFLQPMLCNGKEMYMSKMGAGNTNILSSSRLLF